MELTINTRTYQFKAGFRFLDAIEKTAKYNTADNSEIEWGFSQCYTYAYQMGDARYLAKILLAMNKGLKPELSKDVLEDYLEGLEEKELEELFAQVKDFLLNASVCRLKMKKLGILGDKKAEEN